MLALVASVALAPSASHAFITPSIQAQRPVRTTALSLHRPPVPSLANSHSFTLPAAQRALQKRYVTTPIIDEDDGHDLWRDGVWSGNPLRSIRTLASRRRRGRPNYGQFRGNSQFSLKAILGGMIRVPTAQKVTLVLLLVNIFFFVFQSISPRLTNIGIRANDLVNMGQTHRLWTSIFLHGGFMHLLINSLTLKNYGPEVEKIFGPIRFFVIYFLSGFAGNLVGLWYGPYHQMSLGASGAIFGVIGALLAHIYRTENKVTVNPTGISVNSLLFTIGINVLYGMQPHSRIDNYAHLGGLAAGVAIGWLTGPQKSLSLTTFSTRSSDPDKDRPILPPLVIKAAFVYTAIAMLAGVTPLIFEVIRTTGILSASSQFMMRDRMSQLQAAVASDGSILIPLKSG